MNMSAPRLSVVIATYQPGGINRVEAMELPRVPDVEYVVSWQEHGQTPVPDSLLAREDVRICRCELKGVSNNRNNGIAHARGEILLMADDDLRYIQSQLREVIKIFDSNPQVQLACFQYTGGCKLYPHEECDLQHPPRGWYASLIEIAFRRQAWEEGLKFNPLFGPGNQVLTGGEDAMLVIKARKMGLVCRFFPLVITHHEGLSTGQREPVSSGLLRTAGACAVKEYGLGCVPRLIVRSWRLSKTKKRGFLSTFLLMGRGAVYGWLKVKL